MTLSLLDWRRRVGGLYAAARSVRDPEAAWRLWRDGRDLFHVVEVEDYQRMRAYLRDHPANLPWQARMAELLEVEDDYSGNDLGIGLVWELPS